MSSRLHQVRATLALASLLAMCVSAHAAGAGGKEFKGNTGNGSASNPNNYLDVNNGNISNNPPARNDRVKVDKTLDALGNLIPLVLDTVGLEWGSLEFIGGKITGSHGLTLVNSTSTWTGGEFSTVTFNIPGLTIGTGTDTKKITGGAKLNLTGTTTWNADTITTGGSSELNNTGTFTTNFDGKITHDNTGNRATFTNNGTFTKSAGSTGATAVDAIFTNNSSGSVNVGAGKLKLSGSGTSTGNVTVGTDAALQIDTNNFAFNGGALTGNGSIDITGAATATFSGVTGNSNLKVTGGTAKFNGSNSNAGSLTLSSGTVEGTAGTTTTVGGLTWNAGEITTANIVTTGNTTIGASENARRLSNGSTLTLGGHTAWDGSTITTSSGSEISNQAGVTFTASGSGAIAHDGLGERSTFNNAGTFAKGGDAKSATDVQTKFVNSGTLNAGAGTLKLSGGGNSTGSVTIANGARIEVGANDFAFASGTLGGNGTIDITGSTGVVSFGSTNGSANIVLSDGTARFTGNHSGNGSLKLSFGTVDGSGSASIGSLDWHGGRISGTTITSQGAVIGGAQSKRVGEGAQLNLGGTSTWTTDDFGNASNIVVSGSTTKLKNTGTFSINHDGGTMVNEDTNNRAVFENTGTLLKTNTSAGGETEIQARFVNSNLVQIDGGKLKLSGGGSSIGDFTIAAGAAVQVSGSNYAFSAGTLGGSGTLELMGATTSFGNTTGSANLRVSGGTANFDGAHTGTGKLHLASGSVAGSGTAEFSSFDWAGGAVGGTVKSKGQTNITGGGVDLSGELTLGGNTTWNGGFISGSGSAKIANEAGRTFSANGDGFITGGSNIVFNNAGTFEKATAGEFATDIQTRFESTGQIKATAGRLKLSGGGFTSNTVTVGNGAQLEISGSDFAFNGSAINGASGKLALTSNTTTFSSTTSGDAEVAVNGGTAKFDGTHNGAGKLRLAAGSISGAGTANFTSVDWTGGTLGGKVKSTGASTIGGGFKDISGELTLSGATTWDGSQMHGTGSAKIKNEVGATFTVSGSGFFSNGGNATFDNLGTLSHGATGATTEIQAAFTNTGTIDTSAGTLRLTGGGSSSGNIVLGNGANVHVSGRDFAIAGGNLTGPNGKLELGGNTTTFSSNTTGNAEVSVNGGNARFNGTHTGSGKLSLASGNVTGNGTAQFTALDWTSGTVATKLKSTGNTTISGGGTKHLSGGELTLGATTTWDGSVLFAGGGAKLQNEATGTFNAANGFIAHDGSATKATFSNAGTFKKNAGTGTTYIDTIFDSTGSIAIDDNKGGLRLAGGGTASGNISVGAGGKLELASAYTLENVTLSGAGEIELSAATTIFKNSSGTGKVAVRGGNLDFDGTLSTLGTLAIAAGSVTATKGSAEVGTLEWTGGDLNGKIKATGSANFSGGNAKTIGTAGELTLSGETNTITGGAITNQGKFTKNGAGLTDVQTSFESSGVLNADVGTLKLSGGGRASGSVNVGGKLDVASSYTFENAALNGAGAIELSAATTKFKNTTGNAKVSVNGGNLDFDGLFSSLGTLSLASGNVTTTAGSADVTALEWTGGNLNGKVRAIANATLSGGTKTIGTAGDLTLSGTTHFVTGGALTNLGKFNKADSGTTEIQAVFDSTGALNADAGTLRLAGGGKASGNLTIGSGARVEVAANYTFENLAHGGGGSIDVSGGTATFKSASGSGRIALHGGNANFDTSVSAASKLTLASGSANSVNGGSADVTALEWSGGTLNAKVKSGGATFGGGTKDLGSTAHLTLNGTTTWDGSHINASGAAKIRNESGATFIANGDGVLANFGSAAFTNNGMFTKSGGNGGSTQVQTRFENNGTVNVNSGKLVLQGGGNNSGSILVGSAAALEIAGNLELSTNSTLSGNGVGRLLGGTLAANGSIGVKTFSFEGGSLAGTNSFTGTVDWSLGDWNSAGTTTIVGTLNLRGASHDFSSRGILNQGTVNWQTGNLRGGNGSVFTNSSIFNDLGTGNKSLSTQGGATSFTNNGEYRKTGVGTTTVDGTFTNNGGLKIAAGAMVFAGTFTNNGQINLTNGATAQFAGPLTFGTNSPLSGAGTINAPLGVTAAGLVSPGISPGALSINGDLTLLSTSTLLIELGGPVQGSSYDFLNVTGAGILAGSLHVTFLNGYQWSVRASDTFTILNATALSGAFSNTLIDGRMSSFDHAATFKVTYGLNSVTLSEFVVAVPEPSTYVMLGLGAVVVFWSIRRRRK